MSIVQSVETLPQQRGGNYEVARFNALRHGILSQHTVLPWEDGEEYRALLEALLAEHQPRGPTEEHLVEELAGIIWRKRRLRLGESAAHHRALKHACDPYQKTAEAALINVAGDVEDESVDDAIRSTGEQTSEDCADLESDQAMTEQALGQLDSPSSSAVYSRALAALRDDTRTWWEEQLSWNADDYEEDQTPYSADVESLKRFLKAEVLPWYEKRRQELENRPLIRTQAFGEAVDPNRLERLAPLRGSSRPKARTHARDAIQAARTASRREPDLIPFRKMSYPHLIIWHRIGSPAAVDPRDRQSGSVELDKLQPSRPWPSLFIATTASRTLT